MLSAADRRCIVLADLPVLTGRRFESVSPCNQKEVFKK